MADISPDAVKTARQSGYSDDEIVSFLSQKAPDQFKAAADAGYSSTQILDHLATPKNTSFAGAVNQGVSDVVTGVGKTVKDYVAPEAGAKVEDAGKKLADPNYKSATEDFMNRGGSWYDKKWSSLPRALAENAPALATDVLAGLVARRLGGNVAGALGAGGSYLLRTRGEAAESRARNRTGDENATPSTEDKVIAGAAGVPEAALGAFGANRFINPGKVAGTGAAGAANAAKKLATTAAIEGGVGAGQDVIGQVADTAGTPGGLRVDPGQTFGSSVISATTGTAMGAAGAASDLNNARRFRKFDTDAASRVANRIQDNAEGALDNTKTARKAVGAAETDIKSDLSNAFSTDPDVKAAIDADASARRALARLNSGDQVTDADISNISRAASGTRAGDTVASLASELTAIRTLQKMGDYGSEDFKGGISSKVEKGVRAIRNPIGYGVGGALASAGLAGPAMAMGIAPASLTAGGALVGGYLATRALDKATGYRSPAKTFVDKFGGTGAQTPAIAPVPQPQRPGPTGPSVSAANTFNGKAITPPFGSTPVATPADLAKRDARFAKVVGTALDRGVAQQNREDASQQNSIDAGGDMVGRLGAAQVRGDMRIAATKARAAEMEERRTVRDQIADATGQMAARKATTQMQTREAQDFTQARRANDNYANRGDIVQKTDARELTAARRANEKLQAQHDAAASEAENARQDVGSDGQMTPDTLKSAQKLVKSLTVVQKLKDKQVRAQAAADKAQADAEARQSKEQDRIAKANAKAQATAEKLAAKQAKEAAKVAPTPKPAPAPVADAGPVTVAPAQPAAPGVPLPKQAAKPVAVTTKADQYANLDIPDFLKRTPATKEAEKPQAKAEAKPSRDPLHLLDEAPWAYADDNKSAAKMVLAHEVANGRDITNKAGYLKATEKRLDAQEGIVNDIAKDAKTREQKQQLQSAMARIKSARSQAQAKEYRDAMKEAMPELSDSIDRHFSDNRISTIWKKGT